jgi:hypothetical protein
LEPSAWSEPPPRPLEKGRASNSRTSRTSRLSAYSDMRLRRYDLGVVISRPNYAFLIGIILFFENENLVYVDIFEGCRQTFQYFSKSVANIPYCFVDKPTATAQREWCG